MNNKSEMQWFKLTPTDVWFFRDGRPSNAGEDQSDLRSIFPPHPQTVVGAFRAALSRTMGWVSGPWSDAIKQKLGDGFDDVSPLAFTPPILARETDCSDAVQLLYPVPQHVLGEMKSKIFTPRSWLGLGEKRYTTDIGEILLPMFPQQDSVSPRLRPADGFFVTTYGLQEIVEGRLPASKYFVHQDDLFAFENRIGINRDPDNRSMFSPGFVRLSGNVSLIVGIRGLDAALEVPTLFPLGGESRMTHCERLEQSPALPVSTIGDLVLLLSPASFENAANWYGAGPGESAEALSDFLNGKVATCVVDRPAKIGGFDSRLDSNKSSLPLNPFTAAGSVWWLDQSNQVHGSNGFSLGARTSLGYGSALLAKRPN